MKIQKIDITPEKILDLLRDNFVFIIIAGIITFLLDYRDIFKGPDGISVSYTHLTLPTKA